MATWEVGAALDSIGRKDLEGLGVLEKAIRELETTKNVESRHSGTFRDNSRHLAGENVAAATLLNPEGAKNQGNSASDVARNVAADVAVVTNRDMAPAASPPEPEVEEQGEELPPRQVRAIELLLQGMAVVDVARAVGVNPRTVFRWLKDDHDFLTRYQHRRREESELVDRRLDLLANQALASVIKRLLGDDAKVGLAVLKGLGFLPGKRPDFRPPARRKPYPPPGSKLAELYEQLGM